MAAIFDNEPVDWKELQSMVGEMFAEVGCETNVSKVVETVRGKKEIDVYALDTGIVPPTLYLCECKHWKRPVPQEVVHSFRTVVGDIGAHRGFIISSGGFQAGAFEAAQNTNIDLVTFERVQDVFFDRWRVQMGRRFVPASDLLFPYWDFPGRMPKFKWEQKHVDRQAELIEAYQPIIHLGPLAEWEAFKTEFPLTLPAVDDKGNIGGDVRIESYRQLFNFIDRNKDTALRHFQILHGEITPDRLGEYDPLE